MEDSRCFGRTHSRKAAVCRGDGSCIVFVLAKGICAVPNLRKPSRAERDDATFAESHWMLCSMTPSCSVADVVLSRFGLHTTCMYEQVLAQRPNCGAPLGALGSGPRSLVCAQNTRINEPPAPKAGRWTLLLEGGAAESGSLGVRKPPVECCEGQQTKHAENSDRRMVQKGDVDCGTAGWSKARRCMFGTYCLLHARRSANGNRLRLPTPCCEARQGYGYIVSNGMVFQILPTQTKQTVTCAQPARSCTLPPQ